MNDYRKELLRKPPLLAPNSDRDALYPFNSTLVRRARSVAAWPLILVVISLVNVVLNLYRAPIRSPFGLYLTELIFALGHFYGPVTTVLAMVVIAAILGLLTTCGILTFRFHAWAYTVSIAVLGIDTLLMMALTFLTGSWGILVISSICRAGIIYSLYLGSQAAKLYRHRLLNGQA